MKLDYSVNKQDITNDVNKLQEQKEKGQVAKTAISKQSVATAAMGLPQQSGGQMTVQQTNNGFGRTS